MKYFLDTLSNNLSFITAPVSGIQSANIAIAVKAGSRYETASTNGAAHFLEHIVFRGTKRFPQGKQQLAREVEKVGGILNGGTGKQTTTYYITVPSKHLEKVFPVLEDLVFNPLIRQEDVDRERGVIIEEINMYDDDPGSKVHRLIDEVSWPDHPLGRDVGGTKEVINSLSSQDLARFFKSFYTPSDMVVGLAGNFSAGFSRKVKDILSAKPGLKNKGYTPYTQLQTKPQFRILNRETEQTHFCLNFRAYPHNHPDRRAIDLLMAILGQGLTSRLFIQLRENRGLAYAIYGTANHYQDVGDTQIYAGVPNGKAQEAAQVVLEELSKIKNQGVTAEELAEKKEHLKGVLAISLERSSALNSFLYSQQILLGEIKTYDEVCTEIDSVTKEDIGRVAKNVFVDQGLNFALIGPMGSSENFIENCKFNEN